ncbi:BatD family protein [Gallaecimonas sp. GXIMD4217]|uniref:BatD family protein n=1 Tax=Gallaecimonas sp. GXIMD4217 TaxID=3131927 RepID=UPI00311B2D9E
MRTCLLLAALLASLSTLAASKVTANLDRTRIPINESVVLEIEADDNLPGSALDLSPLEADFQVGRSTLSRAARLSGNGMQEITRWRINLTPRRRGKLLVPSLTVAELVTAPIKLEVVAKDAAKAPDLLLQVETSSDTAYVGAQLGYTVRLLVARDLKSGQLSAPAMANAELRMLGKETESQTTHRGRNYKVFTREYAIFPHQAGTALIEGPVFEGELFEQDARGFYQTREVSKVAPPTQVVVKAAPAGNQPWLPALELQLEERWSKDPGQWQVGEPITRTLVLTAKGTQASALPPLDFQSPAGFKRYPDENQRDSFFKDGWLHAQQLLSIALVPTQAGELVLPAVDVTWFDIQSGDYKTQRLPEQVLTIAPGQEAEALVADKPEVVASTDAGFWPWLSALLAMGWAGSGYMVLRGRRQALAQQQAEDDSPGWLSLRHALLSHDADRAAQALLSWARDRYQIHSLEALAEHLDSQALGQAMAELQRHRFDRQKSGWDGRRILDALSEARKKKPAPLPGDGLYAHLKL